MWLIRFTYRDFDEIYGSSNVEYEFIADSADPGDISKNPHVYRFQARFIKRFKEKEW